MNKAEYIIEWFAVLTTHNIARNKRDVGDVSKLAIRPADAPHLYTLNTAITTVAVGLVKIALLAKVQETLEANTVHPIHRGPMAAYTHNKFNNLLPLDVSPVDVTRIQNGPVAHVKLNPTIPVFGVEGQVRSNREAVAINGHIRPFPQHVAPL